MRKQYPLFQSHLDLAHSYWEQLIQPGDIVVDATCGNGHDTLILAKLALTTTSGTVIGMDIQAKAIDTTRQLLEKHLTDLSQITLLHQCHSTFPSNIHPVRLVVYNLGYLPGADKTFTTQTNTTIQSLETAQQLLMPGGAISITCYPGHAEGKTEQNAILSLVAELDPRDWSVSHHQWLNRQNAPSLLLIQKSL